MKRLLLLRHAKAVPGDTRTEDHERALSARGLGDAALMGAEMHHRLYVPDLALCSTSRRTKETWERLAPEFDAPPKIEFQSALYLASARTIFKLVRAASDALEVLLVLGHNPGMEDCATSLARDARTQEERARFSEMREKYSTCALAVLEFDVTHWQEIDAGEGTLVDFIRPKDLKSE